MAQFFGLSAEQVAHIRPLISQGTGCERVDDRKVLSGIIHVTQKGLRWLPRRPADGPHTTLYNRCRRW